MPATVSIRLGAATRATYVVFAGCGFQLASWVARIPQLRDHLDLRPAQLGWVLLFIFGPNLPVALTGALLWGVGTAFGYPVGMSAGADDPRHATARVTVISTVGKLAAFTGPPMIGLLGDHVTVLRALLVVAALQGVALLIAGATKPLAGER
ncbi:hypothetical protein Aple_019470 [Acrocarpospora pleiomorpha]|uniref:Major facilitator superfamily (MFS) profile domain-containing protein n=1 Tax=Acrocarpospora pleiomorpha TaxID=90975 RepID=A0A5M3XHC5_9ACTN|nr:hypothetical protein [Acrocarpospora pleiomorpha]GES19051.1 hypothetical protein Aple_019470 [Acrocarpospora pleiomorpha]